MLTKDFYEYLSDYNNLKSTVPEQDFSVVWFQKDHGTNVNSSGSEIVEFFRAKCVFITGGTGFLGRLLLEKLLRACPDIDRIYLLIRAKKGKDVDERIDALFADEVFGKMKKLHPKYHHKIVPIEGDVSLPGLGISAEDRKVLSEKVNIFFHVAATVKFDEKLKTATNINIKGTQAAIALGKECQNLNAYIHVSTAYANCPQKEIKEIFYETPISVDDLIGISEKYSEAKLEDMTPKILGNWPNTYTFTKSLAETVVKDNQENLPISVYRPAIIISTYREPVKSWTNNFYGPVGLIVATGLGIAHTMYADGSVSIDMVPGDFVVNGMIAAAFRTGKTRETKIYNHVSSAENRISVGDFKDLTEKGGHQTPSSHAMWYSSYYTNKHFSVHLLVTVLLHYIPGLFLDLLFLIMGKKPMIMKIYKKLYYYNNLVGWFALKEWKFQNGNTQQLWNTLTDVDKRLFPFSISELNWDVYSTTTCLGCRTFVLKESLDTLPAARRKWKILKVVHNTMKYTLILVVCYFVYKWYF